MVSEFYNQSLEFQRKWKQRFANQGFSSEQAVDYWDRSIYSSEDFKNLTDENQIKYFELKEISHIKPRAHFPDEANDLTNILLEDISENQDRSDSIMSLDENMKARSDAIHDIFDGDIDDDGEIDLKHPFTDSEDESWSFNLKELFEDWF